MTDQLRWGLLSTAGINRAVIDPIRQSTRSELSAVASRDRTKAEAYAREQGIPRAFGSYEAMLADPNIDAVYISLPNSLHKEWTVKAADAGKHVLCEKPIVIALDELDEVETAAARNGVVVFEAFMYLHHPQTRSLLSLVHEGAIGRLQMLSSSFHFYLPPENSDNIRLSASLSGGGLWDVGVYPTSLAVSLAGGVAPVSIWADQTVGETGVDVLMNGQLKFDDGYVAQISSGLRQPGPAGAIVVGDAGIIAVETPWKPDLVGPNRLLLERRGGETEIIEVEPIDPYLCEIEAMEACVLDGAEPIVPLSHSRAFLTSVLGMYESARSGTVVRP